MLDERIVEITEIRRSRGISCIKLLNQKRRLLRGLILGVVSKENDPAHDLAVVSLALLERMLREDGKDSVQTTLVLDDLKKRGDQFHENYAPFKRACMFVNDLVEKGEVSVLDYL